MAMSLSVILPAYNEQDSVGMVVERINRVLHELERPYEIIVINDGSSDETGREAREAGAHVVEHPYNIGNGAAIKSGIRNASGEVLITMDADGQHAPEDIPRLLAKLGQYDMVVGARNSDSDTALHRDIANRIYNLFAAYVCGRKIDDLTSGFRAVKAGIARGFVYLLPNTFSYPTTITMATVRAGYSLTYVPVKTARRVGRSKIRPIRDGSRFFLIILKIATLFSPLKVFLPISLTMFLLGAGYGLYRYFVLGWRYGDTSAMLMTVSVLMFLIGLVSEQVAQLRFDRSEAVDVERTLSDEIGERYRNSEHD
jgi:glycosyltransferase involved in cell wall biosynthesis